MFSVLASTNAGSITDILQLATQMLTWILTSMGSIVSFVVNADNFIVLAFYFIGLISVAIGFLVRLMRSVR